MPALTLDAWTDLSFGVYCVSATMAEGADAEVGLELRRLDSGTPGDGGPVTEAGAEVLLTAAAPRKLLSMPSNHQVRAVRKSGTDPVAVAADRA